MRSKTLHPNLPQQSPASKPTCERQHLSRPESRKQFPFSGTCWWKPILVSFMRPFLTKSLHMMCWAGGMNQWVSSEGKTLLQTPGLDFSPLVFFLWWLVVFKVKDGTPSNRRNRGREKGPLLQQEVLPSTLGTASPTEPPSMENSSGGWRDALVNITVLSWCWGGDHLSFTSGSGGWLDPDPTQRKRILLEMWGSLAHSHKAQRDKQGKPRTASFLRHSSERKTVIYRVWQLQSQQLLFLPNLLPALWAQ